MITLLSTVVFAQSVSRSVSSSVSSNQQVTITLTTAGISGNYFTIVRDNIPIGWTYVSGGAQDGNQVKLFLTSLTSSSASYVLNSPSSATTSTFSGTYQFTDDATPQSITGTNQVVVSGNGGNGNGGGSSSGFGGIGWIIAILIGFFILYQIQKK